MNLDHLLRRWFFKLVASCVLLLALNILAYLFGVSKLGQTADSEKSRVEANAKQVDELETKVKNAAQKVGALESGRAALNTLYGEHLKTRAVRLAETQREVDKLIREAGLSHEGLSYDYGIVPSATGKKRPPQEFWEMRTRVSATGSYPQIKQFLGNVQASPHFLVIDDLSLRASTQGAVLISIATVLSTYYLADGEPPLPAVEKAP